MLLADWNPGVHLIIGASSASHVSITFMVQEFQLSIAADHCQFCDNARCEIGAAVAGPP